MTDEIKPETIKKTQDILGKYIKKPPLTEKLLKKPPFRFLHDIITNVIKETGFLNGLHAPEELNHENIKDRDGKILFLQKVIDAVKTITGTSISARPSKIVAGHEPSKTNELLQTIGKALDKKLSSDEYVANLQKGSGEKKDSKTSIKEEESGRAKARDRSRSKGKLPLKESSSTGLKAKQRTKETSAPRRTSVKGSSAEGKAETAVAPAENSTPASAGDAPMGLEGHGGPADASANANASASANANASASASESPWPADSSIKKSSHDKKRKSTKSSGLQPLDGGDGEQAEQSSMAPARDTADVFGALAKRLRHLAGIYTRSVEACALALLSPEPKVHGGPKSNRNGAVGVETSIVRVSPDRRA